MLSIDLRRLESPERFQQLCYRLARREFPKALPLHFASWDGGRDILNFGALSMPESRVGDVIWQCKFTDDLGANTRRSIEGSLAALKRNEVYADRIQGGTWVLCIPIDPTGVFLDWLREKVDALNMHLDVWGRSFILEKLEQHPDLVETFFFAIYEEVRAVFATDDLELLTMTLDSDCQWHQSDANVLAFGPTANVESPDLILDLVVRNRGRIDTVITALLVSVFDHTWNPHGLPGAALLLSSLTYNVSLHHGRQGHYKYPCEPPLIVPAGAIGRFKVRCTDTGYAWYGAIKLALLFGKERQLPLPAFRLNL